MYGYRQLKGALKKWWKLLVSVCSAAIIFLHLHHAHVSRRTVVAVPSVGPSSITLIEKVHTTEAPKPSKPALQIKRYDVLLNSYMRSGSSLTGMILGWRDDVFYLYEPLLKISPWSYWQGNDTICRSDRLECRTVETGNAVQDKKVPVNRDSVPGRSLMMAKRILTMFYGCQFNDFEGTVYLAITNRKGGPSWGQVATCIKEKVSPKLCLQRYAPTICKNATHRVSKVLRLTTDLLSDILRERENLKVIHLFRDPRAIINSRNRTSWYPARTTDKLMANAKSLCNKMLYDLKEGKKLLKLYPDRFRFIYYEELTENPLKKSKMLFKYLGMDLNENKYPKVRQLSVFSNLTKRTSRENNTAFWWRHSLDWDIVQQMEPVCSEVYKELGYKSISNEEEYRNLSISSVDIPKDYLLT